MSAMGEGDSDDEFFKPKPSKEHKSVKKIYSPPRSKITYNYKFEASSDEEEDDEKHRIHGEKSPKRRHRRMDSPPKAENAPPPPQMAMTVPMSLAPAYPMMGFPNQPIIPVGLPMGVMPMMMNIAPHPVPVPVAMPGQFPPFGPPRPSGVPPRGPLPPPPRAFPSRPPTMRQPFVQREPVPSSALKRPREESTSGASITRPPQIKKEFLLNAKSKDKNKKEEDKPATPVFKNDGSFLEMFKKMQKEEEEKKEETKKEDSAAGTSAATAKMPLGLVGKRRGGRVLKTGVVEKAKQEPPDSEPSPESKDAWSIYMAEVKKYREANCQDEGKTRALVK